MFVPTVDAAIQFRKIFCYFTCGGCGMLPSRDDIGRGDELTEHGMKQRRQTEEARSELNGRREAGTPPLFFVEKGANLRYLDCCHDHAKLKSILKFKFCKYFRCVPFLNGN
ncbi:hypothetical protein TNCT_322831 [Trichonephila clavata]|uniref:Uncharacterized protein n=1 Tax=Trichonephila clavata TaxID=2740835 RepID=A0A8X6LBK5_TRICU|nr:hypothetical protein TNCT_322831 [Trichonephila clavata]